MRALFIPVAVAAGLALAPAAFAAETTTGMIKSIDAKAHILTLDNGTVYTRPSTVKDGSMKVGDKVSVMWDMKAGKHQAESVTMAK
jgi:Cu/Ag efflux protein CusF